MVAFLCAQAFWIPMAFADRCHLQNGQMETGQFKEIVGEWVFLKNPQGQRVRFKRLELASRTDRVETKDGTVYEGEIKYGSPFNLEIKTKNGSVLINRWKIRDIEIGLPAASLQSSPLQPSSFLAPANATSNNTSPPVNSIPEQNSPATQSSGDSYLPPAISSGSSLNTPVQAPASDPGNLSINAPVNAADSSVSPQMLPNATIPEQPTDTVLSPAQPLNPPQ
jgi:hypothetical protein